MDATVKELGELLSTGRQACGSLQIAGSSGLSTIGLAKKLQLVPGLVADWKQSSAQGDSRTALTFAKAHYPELDLNLITSRIPESGEDGAPVDKAIIWQSMLGYDQLYALGTQLNVYYKHMICLDRQVMPRHRSLLLLQVLMAATMLPPHLH
jgi:hypothetical protein